MVQGAEITGLLCIATAFIVGSRSWYVLVLSFEQERGRELDLQFDWFVIGVLCPVAEPEFSYEFGVECKSALDIPTMRASNEEVVDEVLGLETRVLPRGLVSLWGPRMCVDEIDVPADFEQVSTPVIASVPSVRAHNIAACRAARPSFGVEVPSDNEHET